MLLYKASALYQAERIQVPVLLIHGDQDGAAPVEESRRLAARLAALGRDVELVVIAGGHHVFNFKHPVQAQEAWQVTLQWLAHHILDAPKRVSSILPPPPSILVSFRSACLTSLRGAQIATRRGVTSARPTHCRHSMIS